MLICYPDHYIPSTMPILNLDEYENEVYNTSRNIPVNIFEEIDQEYVNKTLNNI